MTLRTDKILGKDTEEKEEPEAKVFLKTGKDVSDEFRDAWVHTGSIRASCDYCHRTYFNGDEINNFENGEFKELKQRQEEKPSYYHETDYSINTVEGMNGEIIVGCYCGMDVVMENWIWRNRHDIMRYLADRIKKEFKDKKEEYDKIMRMEVINEFDKK